MLRRKLGVTGPTPAFDAHERVRVSLINSKNGRVLAGSHEGGVEGGHHLDHVTLVLSPEGGRNVTLDLILNKDLVPDSYFEKSHKEVRRETFFFLGGIKEAFSWLLTFLCSYSSEEIDQITLFSLIAIISLSRQEAKEDERVV